MGEFHSKGLAVTGVGEGMQPTLRSSNRRSVTGWDHCPHLLPPASGLPPTGQELLARGCGGGWGGSPHTSGHSQG